MNLINLKILTPKGIYFQDDVYRIDLKTKSGSIGVLKGHVPIVSGLEIDQLSILDKQKKPTKYALAGGLLNVSGDEAIIITLAIESTKDIDKKRAELAKSKAQQLLSDSKKGDKSMLKAELALKRAINRLKV